MLMLNYLLVGLGGALGSIARFWISGLVSERYGSAFPLGTLVVNVIGSFAIGLFAALAVPDGRWLVSPSARLFFMVGVCGGYTTFSAFSLQTFALMQAGEWLRVAANCILSVGLCLAAVWLGFFVAALLNRS